MTDSIDGDAVVEAGEATEATDAPEPEDQVAEAEATEDKEPEDHQADDDAEPEPLEEEGEEAEDGEADVEEFEIDLGGNKHKFEFKKGEVPEAALTELQKYAKGIEGEFTRRIQATTEREQSTAKREEFVGKLQTMSGEMLETFAKGQQLKAEIAQLSQIDVDALWTSNPDEARRISDLKAAKQAEFNQTIADVDSKEKALTQAQEAEVSRRREEGAQMLEKRIKGFSEKVPEVVEYMAQNYGLDKEDAMKNWSLNPAFAEVAYKAMQFDRGQARARKPANTQRPVKPVKPPKSGSAGNSKAPAQMTEGEIAKYLELTG